MAGEKRPGMIRIFVRRFFGSIGLMICPVPISIFRRQLAGKKLPDGTVEFYAHPDFICTMHLIWVGWLVTIGAFYNDFAATRDWAPLIPVNFLSWPWLFVLAVTLIVLGLEFGRVALGFLIAAIAIFGLGLGLIQTLSNIAIFADMHKILRQIPVSVDWGVPFVISLCLGINYVSVAAWRRMNDVWILKPVGNYLEHANFQERDRTIAKGAKTFVAVYPCLIRRYLFFGFGDIEVRSATGTTVVDRIQGVLFARTHSDMIISQFATTDVSSAYEAEEEESEGDGV